MKSTNALKKWIAILLLANGWLLGCGDSSGGSGDDDSTPLTNDDDLRPPPPGGNDDGDLPPPPPPGDDDDDDFPPPPPPGDDDDDDFPPPPPPGDDDDDDDPPPVGDDDDDDPSGSTDLHYPIVDTGQSECYDTRGDTGCPSSGQSEYGQDAQVDGIQPAYRSNGDGTVTDLNTGLMWTYAKEGPMMWDEAMDAAEADVTGGYSDWRLPSIKELYSLIDFRGAAGGMTGIVPFIDEDSFEFFYGDPALGQREIDVQEWSSTMYVSTTMNGAPTAFGVNFADGRIKGYPAASMGGPGGGMQQGKYARYVRGSEYGINDFEDLGDGTVADHATGLTWQQADDGATRDWPEALAYCEGLSLAGQSDWRLPNAKELQSIVDYTRSPATHGEAAIDPVFDVSDIESYYWTSTTHVDGPADIQGTAAVYIAFGRAMGYMEMPPGSGAIYMDVHGAGAQRSDPKVGDPNQFPNGRGPQGDDVRIYNYVRCVRSAE